MDAIETIIDCILHDVAMWERDYCETPERIFVSPRLEKILKDNYSSELPIHYENTRTELFGIPLSVYRPSYQTELGYYLADRGRRLVNIEEAFQSVYGNKKQL